MQSDKSKLMCKWRKRGKTNQIARSILWSFINFLTITWWTIKIRDWLNINVHQSKYFLKFHMIITPKERTQESVSISSYTMSKYCTTQNPGSVDGHWSVVTSAILENVFCDAASCTVMRKGILPSRLLGFCRLMFTRSHQKFSTDYKSK